MFGGLSFGKYYKKALYLLFIQSQSWLVTFIKSVISKISDAQIISPVRLSVREYILQKFAFYLTFLASISTTLNSTTRAWHGAEGDTCPYCRLLSGGIQNHQPFD
jgi:hypothetical protein